MSGSEDNIKSSRNIWDLLNFWTVEFVTPDLEKKYKNWELSERLKIFTRNVSIGLTFTLLFSVSDYFLLGANELFFQLLYIRIALVSFCLLYVIFVNYSKQVNYLDYGILVVSTIFTLVSGYIVYKIAKQAEFIGFNELMLIFAYYLFLPQRFILLLISGFFATVVMFLVDISFPGVQSATISNIFIAFTLANIFGIIHARLVHVQARQEFIDLLIEAGFRRSLNKQMDERVRLGKELRRQAITDPLTGIHNRRFFIEAINKEIDRYKRYSEKFSLLLIDIDHFKKLNDSYGHAVGDKSLIQMTKICKSHIRSIDTFARIGGEEFVILAPQMDLSEAVKLAERIRAAVATESHKKVVNKKNKTNKTNKKESANKGKKEKVSITISVGVAVYTNGSSLDKIMVEADNAMYKAKKKGRNLVVSN